jgi:hypothetical protein
MKRIDYRILVGAALILVGILMLLDTTHVLPGATNYFWVGLLAIGAGVFLYWFFSEGGKWWAAIPGFTLAGLACSILLKGGWSDLAVLGGIGVGFWAVYFSGRQRWWAIIPGGVLITLGITSALSVLSAYNEAGNAVQTGGFFFAGLGLTFLLVALLARMKWAFIPAAVLLLLGFFLTPPFSGVLGYAWIGILLVAGAAMVISAVRSK